MFYDVIIMRFGFGQNGRVLRVFEPVQTVDEQYNIWDCGVEQEDGSIDSIVVGGSFSLLKQAFKDAEAKPAEPKKAENKVVSTGGPAAVAAVHDQPPASVTKFDGETDQDIEGL